MAIFHSYVSLPEGNQQKVTRIYMDLYGFVVDLCWLSW